MFTNQLPDSLLSVIYSEWIGTKDVVNLDSALTNENHRISFLNVLSSDVISVAGLATRCYKNDKQNLWAKARGLVFNTLFGAHKKTLENYSKKDLLKIKEIQFDGLKTAVSLINLCPNLTSLTFRLNESEAGVLVVCKSIDKKILKQMKSISPVAFASLPLLTKHCTQLTTIGIFSKSVVFRKLYYSDSSEEDDKSVVDDAVELDIGSTGGSDISSDNSSDADEVAKGDVEENRHAFEERMKKSTHLKLYKALVALTSCNPNLKRISFAGAGKLDAIKLSQIPDLRPFNLDHVQFTAPNANSYFLLMFPDATAVEVSFSNGYYYPTDGLYHPEWYDCCYDKYTQTITIELYIDGDDDYLLDYLDEKLLCVTPVTTTLVVNRMCFECCYLLPVLAKRPTLSEIHFRDVDCYQMQLLLNHVDKHLNDYIPSEQQRTFSIYSDDELVYQVVNGVNVEVNVDHLFGESESLLHE